MEDLLFAKPLFLRQNKNGEPLTIVGDGKQTRDFVFVTDVVDAFFKAAKTNSVGEIFNLGNGKINFTPFLIFFFSLFKISFLKCHGKTR